MAKEILVKSEIQRNAMPCLICGRCVRLEESSQSNNAYHEHPVVIKQDVGEGESSNGDLFRCLVKACQVKLNRNAMTTKKDGDDGNEDKYIPHFCHNCKEQVEMLLQLQRKIRELEKALQEGTVSVKAKMVESEGVFKAEKIYARNEKYFYIRRKILGRTNPGQEVLHHLPHTRRSSRRTLENSNCLEDKMLDLNLSLASKQALPNTDEDDQTSNENNSQMAGIVVEVKEELDLDSRENFNEELDEFVDSHEPFSPRVPSSPFYSPSNEESNQMELDRSAEESMPKSIHRKTKMKNASLHKGTSKKQVKGYNQQKSTNACRSPCKKKNAGKMKATPEQRDNDDYDYIGGRCEASRKHIKRGSYNKAKIHIDLNTGHYQYLQVRFEKLADDKYKCLECLELVWNESTMKKHTIRSHTNTFVCDICGQHKASCSDLNKHKREVHQGQARKAPEKNMECPVCGKPFGHKTALEFHKVTHFSEDDKREAVAKGEIIPDYKDRIKSHQCGICGVIFNNVTWLKKHEKTKHPKNDEERFETQRICPECGKSFSEAYFKQHMERYHSNLDVSKVKPYQCSVCDKRFYTTTSLVEHKRTHTGERPFKCKLCDKDFISKNRLKYHNMQNHENMKPFACISCSAAFVTSYKLRRHVATVHEGKSQKDWNATKNNDNGCDGDGGTGEVRTSSTKPNVVSIVGTVKKNQSANQADGQHGFYVFK